MLRETRLRWIVYFRPLEGTFSYTQENYAFWQKVYSLNQRLPETERIQVVGTDIEHQVGSAIAYLTTLLPEKEAPEIISGLMQLVRQVPYQSRGSYTSLISDLQESIVSQSSAYEEYLGDRWLDFQFVVDNLAQRDLAYQTREQAGQAAFNQVRDSIIYQNFVRISPQLPPGKFYGQWGSNHIFQHEQNGTRWFGTYLQASDNEQHSSVLSILYLYQGSQRMNRDGRAAAFDMQSSVAAFHQFGSTPYTLFNLDEPGSPFHEQLFWPDGLGTSPNTGATTDFFSVRATY